LKANAIFVLRSFTFALTLTASLSALPQSQRDLSDHATAQSAPANRAAVQPANRIPAEAVLELPDAPGYSSSSIAATPAPDTAPSAQPPADARQPYSAAASNPRATSPDPDPARTQATSRYDQYIDPHEIAPPLAPRDKVLLSLRATVTPYQFLSIVSAAGWEHLENSSPNYGTNSEAFAQRVGAAAARRTSGLLLSDGVFAPLLHEDPRYYQLGPQHSIVARTTYAISRVFVTRKDDGGATPNLSLFLGNAATTALTNAYYPQSNRSFKQTAEDYGGSFGGAAFGLVVREFLDQALYGAHIKKKE
jgi:hypothetical protein